MIEVKKLSKRFGSHLVLDELSACFEPGHVYGIVGDNGAGKTTLFRCIAGLESYSGSIVADISPLKNKLGFLSTEPFFFPRITGREYVQLLCNARQVPSGDLDDRNIFALPLDQYANNYSTGMKKKLAFWAVLLQNNEYFILDEPFNGVDIQSNMIISEIIAHLKSLMKTVLISSHIFSTLSNSCDEIHLLKNGTIHRSVRQPEFEALESEMKNISLTNIIDKLGL